MEAAGVIKACRFPGKLDNPTLDAGSFTVYEYTVTTVNGYGESVQSPIADTHPASWANWLSGYQTEIQAYLCILDGTLCTFIHNT